MSYYSDPTAAKALGGINREFSRLVKKEKKRRRRWEAGGVASGELEEAQAQFTGIYRHVLRNVLKEERE